MFLSAVCSMAQSDAAKAFEKLKSLQGTWAGVNPEGAKMRTTYRLTAAGSVLMADVGEGTSMEMVTMFHLDGDRLMLTHYCSAKNQPRMTAKISPDLKTISFNFLDATNVPDPKAGHMHDAVFTFVDSQHYTEEWTWTEAGKASKHRIELQREK
jgi:hypothetical protein